MFRSILARSVGALLLTVLFSCTQGGGPAESQPASSAPATQPAQQDGPVYENAAEMRQGLATLTSKEITDEDRALQAALDLVAAFGDTNQRVAERVIDVVGYQALPLAGRLSEEPPRALPPKEVARLVASERPVRLENLPPNAFEAFRPAALRIRMPEIARWMLKSDIAVVLKVVPGYEERWLAREACLVVRLRADKPYIVAGTLFQARQQGGG